MLQRLKIPWFINKAMYPTKIKKCFPVGKRFLRSERAPTPLGIFPSDEDDEAIQIGLILEYWRKSTRREWAEFETQNSDPFE